MNSLITELVEKNIHYIRCIRPNHEKLPGVFDYEYILSQWRFLGLTENILIRRAGYCLRLDYSTFFGCYRITSSNTWPKYHLDHKEGAQQILIELHIQEEEYKMGKSMIFIKNPSVVIRLEMFKMEKQNNLITRIQSVCRMYLKKKQYKKVRECVIKIQSWHKMVHSRNRYQKIISSSKVLNRHIRGHLVRKRMKKLISKLPKNAAKTIQKCFRSFSNQRLLKDIKHNVKRADARWLHIKWPQAPSRFKATSDILFCFYRRIMALKVRSMIKAHPEIHENLIFKAFAYDHFKLKASWKYSLKVPMRIDYTGEPTKLNKLGLQGHLINVESMLMVIPVLKLNRHDPTTTQNRIAVLCRSSIFVFDEKVTLKEKIDRDDIEQVSSSFLRDGLFVIHCKNCKKGDLVLRNDELCIDFVATMIKYYKVKLKLTNQMEYKASDYSVRILFEQCSVPASKFMTKNNKTTFLVTVS